MLYGLYYFSKDLVACYESGYFNTSVDYPSLILNAINKLNLAIRPQALSLVESIWVHDDDLQSAIGNSYGDIYETHLKWAKESRLNETKMGDAIPDGYMDYMMPILKGKM